MKLYSSPGACSLADHIVLEWIGQPYSVQLVSREERATAEFRRLNPAGAVPVLEQDGWVLTQNVAILSYLADCHPGAGLGGDGSHRSRAEVNRWLAFLNSDMHPAFKPLFGAVNYLGDPAAIDKAHANSAKQLRAMFERCDADLAATGWLAGQRSIADPYLYVMLRWARALKLDLDGLPHLAGFEQTMAADPGVKKSLQAEGLD
ncbi:MAG TPA: glutathione S-transferase N-terminal domain-containing protein [Rhodanobacteraceae bacterium]|nr:glutathione S-transferase N-terminal domain-containing protein [Rhodanobacteraceae bacterium]